MQRTVATEGRFRRRPLAPRGGHEGLIGLGFALGPAGGAVGTMLGGMWRHQALGIWAGVGPILLVCAIGALWPMVAARRRTADQA